VIPGRLLAGALGCVAWSCGSPDEPLYGGPNRVVVEDPGHLLGAHEGAIIAILDSTLTLVAGELQLTGVTISVRPGAGITGYGMGGYTPDGGTVQLTVDPSFPGLAQALPGRLPALAAHELHHAKRWRGPGYGATLLEALISEGLADHFAVEFEGAPVAPWSDAFPRSETEAFLALATPEFDSAAYDHDRWFYGSTSEIPLWTGYTLGFRLVETYQAGHGGESASDLVNTPANAFRP